MDSVSGSTNSLERESRLNQILTSRPNDSKLENRAARKASEVNSSIGQLIDLPIGIAELIDYIFTILGRSCG